MTGRAPAPPYDGASPRSREAPVFRRMLMSLLIVTVCVVVVSTLPDLARYLRMRERA